MIANSAGCERAFSHMGLIHTAIRSKLGVDKVCKTTIVGMDIKWLHLEAGLVRSWGHRNFNAPTNDGHPPETDTSDLDIGDLEDVLDFEQLTEQLIEDSMAEINGDIATEDDELPPLTIRLPLHAIRSALTDLPPQ
jgi:hypothetical protein